MIKTDVLVIGAGPVGLFSAFQCGMLKLDVHVIDALDFLGGQCAALYPEKPIYDIPAFPKIAAGDLIDSLVRQNDPFAPTYHLSQQVMSVEKTSDQTFFVTTSKNVTFETKVIFIAAGVGAFGPNRPPLENLSDFEGKSVFYHVNKQEIFRDKNVVVAGGGDSAVDWALSLASIAKKVTVVHRRNKFRAAPHSEDKLFELAEQGIIQMAIPYQLLFLEGDNGFLSHVGVESLEGETMRIDADFLLPFYGLSMDLGPILQWGLSFNKGAIAIDQSTCETNIPGIYAIGDVATYENKLKLILTGFSEAASAAHSARKKIFPEHVFHFEYSTTTGVPNK